MTTFKYKLLNRELFDVIDMAKVRKVCRENHIPIKRVKELMTQEENKYNAGEHHLLDDIFSTYLNVPYFTLQWVIVEPMLYTAERHVGANTSLDMKKIHWVSNDYRPACASNRLIPIPVGAHVTKDANLVTCLQCLRALAPRPSRP